MIALSSAWRSAPGRRGGEVFDPLLRALAVHPFDAIALDAGVSDRALADVRPILARRELWICALRGAVGAPPPEGEPSPPPRLCAADAGERAAAVRAHLRALEIASELEVPVVAVCLGALDPDPRWGRREGPLRDDEAEDLRRAARAAAAARPRALDAARLALDPLLRRGAGLGVRVAVENPALPTEIPMPEDLFRLLADFRGAPIAYAHDLAAARLLKGLGGPPGREMAQAGREALALFFVSDANEREMGLVPGRGDLDLRGLAAALPPEVPRILSPRGSWSERDLAEAVDRLAEVGFLRRS
jgi:sugar phosphate isomerase/epimerase